MGRASHSRTARGLACRTSRRFVALVSAPLPLIIQQLQIGVPTLLRLIVTHRSYAIDPIIIRSM